MTKYRPVNNEYNVDDQVGMTASQTERSAAILGVISEGITDNGLQVNNAKTANETESNSVLKSNMSPEQIKIKTPWYDYGYDTETKPLDSSKYSYGGGGGGSSEEQKEIDARQDSEIEALSGDVATTKAEQTTRDSGQDERITRNESGVASNKDAIEALSGDVTTIMTEGLDAGNFE